MKSDDKQPPEENFEAWAIRAFTSLQERQLRHMNRQLAMEAMVEVLLARVPAPTLEVLLKDLEGAKDRLAERIQPDEQEPEIWNKWSSAIEAHLQRLRTTPIAPGLQTGLWGAPRPPLAKPPSASEG